MQAYKREANESGRSYALRVLKENIIQLTLEPGSMVSENELAAELGLSRGPVREALIELSKVKIVEVLPQRGSVISLVDYSLVEEARFMRETLEIAVAERLSNMDIAKEHADALRENISLQKLYLQSTNLPKLWELDDQFHSLLFQAAGVSQTHTFMKSMQIHFDRIRVMGTNPTVGKRNVDEHSRIFEAIVARDAHTAKTVMHKNLGNYQIDKETVFEKYPQYIKQ